MLSWVHRREPGSPLTEFDDPGAELLFIRRIGTGYEMQRPDCLLHCKRGQAEESVRWEIRIACWGIGGGRGPHPTDRLRWLRLENRRRRREVVMDERSYQVLGLTCLRAGQTEEAVAHLLAAGRTPGSCTLNSYGPRLLLPKALIKAVRTDAVIEYLDLLAEFWAASKDARFKEGERERTRLIKRWKAQVRKGQAPADPLWK